MFKGFKVSYCAVFSFVRSEIQGSMMHRQ